MSEQTDNLLSMADGEAVVALLQDLIRARSENPPGDTRSAIAVAERFLDDAGLTYEVFAKREEKPSMIATIPAAEGRPTLTFHAHIDTVPAGDLQRWRHDPFSGSIADGRIYGRGAGDDKASAAAMCAALAVLLQADPVLSLNVQLVLAADEEAGGLDGTRWLRDAGHLQPDFLVVGEQTHNHVSVAERVACGIDLTVLGRSAHGAMPWVGDNAVMKTARALTWLLEQLGSRFESRTHPHLPPPTLNVGRIDGGRRWNVVPERCEVKMDRRLIPGETRGEALAEIEELLERYDREVEPLAFELHSEGEVAPNVNTPVDSPFVEVAQRCLASVAGEERPISGYALTSDGRWFARGAIPIIHFGPGDPALAHASDEYVEVDEVVEAVRFYALFALRWGESNASR